MGCLFVADNIGFQVSSLVTGLGVGGMAIALSSQAMLADVFMCGAMLLSKPFTTGDFISVAGDSSIGQVKSIGLKDTRLTALDGEELVYPNREVGNNRIVKYSGIQSRRHKNRLNIKPTCTVDKLEEIPTIVQEACEDAGFRCRFGGCWLLDVDSLAYKFDWQVYIDEPDIGKSRLLIHAIWVGILRKFRNNGIELAFNTLLPQDQAGPSGWGHT